VTAGTERPGPHKPKFALGPLVLAPDAIGVSPSEPDVAIIGKGVIQGHQVAHEDTLELDSITAAIWFAAVVQNTVGIGQAVNGGQGDFLRGFR